MHEKPTYETVKFGSLAIGDTAGEWGDHVCNYDHPIWITFRKTEKDTAQIIAEGDKPVENGMSFFISPNDEVALEVGRDPQSPKPQTCPGVSVITFG